ncbi:FUSC family protein [Microbacterium sp. SD291]|uniref:FUSC family protein n=1 Tax=Microbacterium sp. SD291 TaxID=2782007 RepID=UPI001A979623|nr:FUSC family protein [Microbacterium sp. SD291]MBO0979097.1 FUSC family protein [Microbacterium sp. SD291]
MREAVRGERLILAAKAAAAASVAWLLAPYVPFADAEYSYYAPLGVLVSMYPTVAGSARAGAQSLAGLGLGLVLGLGALGLVFVGMPAVIAVALVVGAGLVASGIRVLGAGGDWVAIAALFVLLLGGPDADEFSLSYLLTMAFGVLVGVLTNVLVFPPLYLRRAADGLTALRDAVCADLRDVADALDGRAIDAARLSNAGTGLADMLDDAAAEVRVGEESTRANPRSRRRGADRRLNENRMAALERSTRATLELADLLARAAHERAFTDAATRHGLATAVRASADLVEARAADPQVGSRLTAADTALDGAMAHIAGRPAAPDAEAYSHAYAYAAALCVRRIVDASREFVAATG